MKRRTLMLGGLGTAISSVVNAASQSFLQTPNGTQRKAFVAQPTIIRQNCPEWCWAASASMIFAMHQHPVSQERIVQRVFHGLPCMAGQNITVAQVLSSTWQDDNGATFRANVVAAYDFGNRIFNLTDRFMINELESDRPLLFGNNHHAMVLSVIDFLDAPSGPSVQGMGVFDPWPFNQPFHELSVPEMIPQHKGGQLAFIAAVHIS